ncbi:LacI family DNA-binding transcriptional regulator [Cellulomonas sp. ATA003]|uniref:LacI family DNA-binding transcriptional regulator n=1 Tax=Cellulomonas sp. ATA003 TaxID=3073064 RepID=UPI002872E000|nr:LacI family DNA-binding transcriptional regulator [Cellulomonas sp. ATA003]WNB84351.1 LacI family DNA-binding transcriptional regulator [Cellulomonas sp. ATA003]
MSSAASDRPATIWEVARLAGVSGQTVSRYLRFGGEGMRETTREKVSAAIAELNYRPNLAAQAMRARRTGRLALILPSGSAVGSSGILAGATAAAQEAGYSLDAIMLAGAFRDSSHVLELAGSGFFEGVVSVTPLPVNTADGPGQRIPIVVLPDYDEEMRGIGDVADASPIAELIEGLARVGHRRFLHITGDLAFASARSRKEMYLKTIQRLRLESYGVVDTNSWLAEPAQRAVVELPSDAGVTAIIAANDLVAAGAIRGAHERGLRIPDDLSITGWDDNPIGAAMPPSITTVANNFEQFGRRAIECLLGVLNGHRDRSTEASDGSFMSVIWRESTGPAPALACR